MSAATEILVAEQLAQLEESASAMGWTVKRLEGLEFVLGVKARDDSWLYVRCNPDRFPTLPPIWRWCDADGENTDAPEVTAQGGNFFHSAGVICAPWNRLAYKGEDSRGPHNDWTIGDWLSNPYTKQTVTLGAMASRIWIEAQTKFTERKG